MFRFTALLRNPTIRTATTVNMNMNRNIININKRTLSCSTAIHRAIDTTTTLSPAAASAAAAGMTETTQVLDHSNAYVNIESPEAKQYNIGFIVSIYIYIYIYIYTYILKFKPFLSSMFSKLVQNL